MLGFPPFKMFLLFFLFFLFFLFSCVYCDEYKNVSIRQGMHLLNMSARGFYFPDIVDDGLTQQLYHEESRKFLLPMRTHHVNVADWSTPPVLAAPLTQDELEQNSALTVEEIHNIKHLLAQPYNDIMLMPVGNADGVKFMNYVEEIVKTADDKKGPLTIWLDMCGDECRKEYHKRYYADDGTVLNRDGKHAWQFKYIMLRSDETECIIRNPLSEQQIKCQNVGHVDKKSAGTLWKVEAKSISKDTLIGLRKKNSDDEYKYIQGDALADPLLKGVMINGDYMLRGMYRSLWFYVPPQEKWTGFRLTNTLPNLDKIHYQLGGNSKMPANLALFSVEEYNWTVSTTENPNWLKPKENANWKAAPTGLLAELNESFNSPPVEMLNEYASFKQKSGKLAVLFDDKGTPHVVTRFLYFTLEKVAHDTVVTVNYEVRDMKGQEEFGRTLSSTYAIMKDLDFMNLPIPDGWNLGGIKIVEIVDETEREAHTKDWDKVQTEVWDKPEEHHGVDMVLSVKEDVRVYTFSIHKG
eukprot:GHVS01069973.1.p1 GENE.GHVS01069973.1~~GHVS01069973.1.p1  ORF type:complete len:567 (+),score=72.96 GHVS01069973.1:135-1703(+)